MFFYYPEYIVAKLVCTHPLGFAIKVGNSPDLAISCTLNDMYDHELLYPLPGQCQDCKGAHGCIFSLSCRTATFPDLCKAADLSPPDALSPPSSFLTLMASVTTVPRSYVSRSTFRTCPSFSSMTSLTFYDLLL